MSTDGDGLHAEDPLRHPGLPEAFEGDGFEVLATESEPESDGIDDVPADDDEEDMDEETFNAMLAADEFRTSDSEGFPRGVIGDDPRTIPLSILEHFTNPLDMDGVGVERMLEDMKKDLPLLRDASDDDDRQQPIRFNADETSDDPNRGFERPSPLEEKTRLDQYRALKAKIEDPVPIPTRPLWPLYTQILQIDSVTVMSTRGQEQHTRVLVIVGNKKGAAGFGIGKHKEPAQASKLALRNAQRNMIHINTTEQGQLYHDLIGVKNNTQVMLRSVPPRMGQRGSRLIRTVMDFMGVKAFSAKIVGSKTKNRYTIVQALFNAFNHYTPPEEFAAKRGKRIVHVGKDRRFPRDVFPFYPPGPARLQPNTVKKL